MGHFEQYIEQDKVKRELRDKVLGMTGDFTLLLNVPEVGEDVGVAN